MKKITLLIALSAFTLGAAAQDASPYLGDWEMMFIGTPQGDAKMDLSFEMDGQDMKGTITSPDGEVIEVSQIDETDDGITIYFTIQSYDVNVELAPITNDSLSGTLMGMFDAYATRAKAADFFAGKWKMKFIGTPNGDAEMNAELIRENGMLTGTLSGPDGEPIPITNVEETGESITLYFTAQGYDVNVEYTKESDNSLKGSLMGMFDATAERLKE